MLTFCPNWKIIPETDIDSSLLKHVNYIVGKENTNIFHTYKE
jgi:hypothetical protein